MSNELDKGKVFSYEKSVAYSENSVGRRMFKLMESPISCKPGKTSLCLQIFPMPYMQ